MHKILITTSSFGKMDPGIVNILHKPGFDIVFNPFGRKLTENEVLELILQHNPIGIIAGVEPLTRRVLEKAENLKTISRCGIGLDSIDLAASKDLRITITNTPDGPTIAVAELTLGMILALLRGIHTADMNIRNDRWIRPMGHLLQGKTVGIIGCGRIGSHVSALLSAFGCKILGYDIIQHSSSIIRFVSSEDLFNNSDIISIHIPYSSKNHHFFNENRINQCKKGVFLINASRGGLVDEDALHYALVSGQVKGAAIDSFEQEPYRGKLIEHDNVLLTSHIGSYAIEGRIRMERQSIENLIRELKDIIQ